MGPISRHDLGFYSAISLACCQGEGEEVGLYLLAWGVITLAALIGWAACAALSCQGANAGGGHSPVYGL